MDENLKKLQLLLLMCVLEKYDNVIFCGDLNLDNNNPTLNLLKNGILQDVNGTFTLKKKYKSSYDLNSELVTNYSSNKATPKYIEMLDYIFVSDNIKIVNVIN